MTLHNVIIHIKSVLNKDKNRYYYKIFLEKCSYQLAKKIITKLVKTKASSKYLVGYLDRTIRPLVLLMPKMSGYVKTFIVK